MKCSALQMMSLSWKRDGISRGGISCHGGLPELCVCVCVCVRSDL